ncbi:hypothetical protein E3N88_18332 [Mikania micrantha]|uniref:Uncharacterized protein n=1 Tax=Mikania micrantha TaxID=192012 RepID=A0A5N6NUK9_9ASTR|nr:hypothetical protein E3N88_18332 [Mikania micrantha]
MAAATASATTAPTTTTAAASPQKQKPRCRSRTTIVDGTTMSTSSGSENTFPWSLEEEEVLVESWNITTNKFKGKFTGSKFWELVSYCYHLPPLRVK